MILPVAAAAAAASRWCVPVVVVVLFSNKEGGQEICYMAGTRVLSSGRRGRMTLRLVLVLVGPGSMTDFTTEVVLVLKI